MAYVDGPTWLDPNSDYHPSAYALDEATRGDEVYERRMKNAQGAEMDAARDIYRGGARYIGESQMDQGMSAASQAAMGQAVGRGSNPLGKRASMYSGAQMQEQAAAQGGNAVLAERGARDQAMMSALGRQNQYRQMMRDDQTRKYLAGMDYATGREQRQVQEDIADRDNLTNAIGGIFGGVGSALASSDKRAKKLLAENKALKAQLPERSSSMTEMPGRAVPRGPERSSAVAEMPVRSSRSSARALGPAYGGQPNYSGTFNMEHEWRGAHPKQAMEADLYGQPPARDFTAGRPLGEVDQANMQTMRSVDPKVWQYKDDAQQAMGLTHRPQAGPTAQNLESTPIGQHYVYNTSQGKKVDTKNLTLANTGMVSTLQKQVDAQNAKIAELERQGAPLVQTEPTFRMVEG